MSSLFGSFFRNRPAARVFTSSAAHACELVAGLRAFYGAQPKPWRTWAGHRVSPTKRKRAAQC